MYNVRRNETNKNGLVLQAYPEWETVLFELVAVT